MKQAFFSVWSTYAMGIVLILLPALLAACARSTTTIATATAPAVTTTIATTTATAAASATPSPTLTATAVATAAHTPTSSFTPTTTPQPITLPDVPADKTFYVAPDGSDANPGTWEQPWATLNHAAETLRAGEMVLVRGGVYDLTRQVRLKNSGRADAWIIYAGYPGEKAILDARNVPVGPPGSASPWPHDQGAFQIDSVNYVRVQNLTVRNSHNSGFTIRDSSYIELYNNTADTTFSPGIAVWDTNHDGLNCAHHKIIGNTLINTNTWDMAPAWSDRKGEPPHEAISIAGSQYFEVAYNHVYNCDKEGIDVKETSKHGTVHHNYVHHVDRQGLYVDSWFGVLEDVELYENVVFACRGAGIAISVEGGQQAQNIRIHHNLVYNNLGTGLLFGRWGGDGARQNISIHHNTFHHNGWGDGGGGRYFWITGGLYLFSTNLQNIDIRNNIFSDNRGFQIGYSDDYLKLGSDIDNVLSKKNIVIDYNLFWEKSPVKYPINVGWPGNYADVYAFVGEYAVLGDPLFTNPAQHRFDLAVGSPAIGSGDGGDMGAFAAGTEPELWWLGQFPPLRSGE